MKHKTLFHAVSLVTAATALAGCAQPSLTSIQHEQHQILTKTAKTPNVRWLPNGIYISHRSVDYTPGSGSVTLHLTGAPVGGALANLVDAHGYSLFFSGSASSGTLITADIRKSSMESAVRQMAQAAGYCAIIHPHRKRVVIATHGTYFFRVPVTILQNGKASYEVGGDPAAQNSGSSGGMGGGGMGGGGMSGGGMSGGSAGGGGMSASFTISGKSHLEKTADLRKNLQQIMGGGTVTINTSTGIVAVTGDARNLARADDFIRQYVRSAGTSVSLHVALLQVSLNNSLQWGINWSKVVQIAGSGALNFSFPNAAPAISTATGGSGSGSTTTGSSSIAYTGQTISSVIQALNTITNTRVISAPYLTAQDGTPATIYSGKQLPYIGSVSNNISGLSGTSSTGAAFQYVLDGLSMSFIPDILNNHLVSLTIVPVISSVNQFVSATVDGTQLQGPVQDIKETFLHTTIPNNRTLILGGAKETSATAADSQTPGLGAIPGLGYLFKGINNQGIRSQLVILVRAHIHKAPDYNPLIGESL